ncbi:hypothetical protein B0J13DRAFT_459639 [Dactylonectria estremocensis]|uniref:2EXR domain-containing protein n=1 Tax=Dactylonectria estremocensis TaxID=1079267 RepID=A0A9P9DAK2_9HYPO|nr:hypothetical protein B0J13DRAFT_459639 [Dactylonectria estremocensis]
MATASFHPFPRLHFELRALIWGFAAAPRIVHIRTDTADFSSPTPPPAVIQVSQEARRYAPYRKSFFTTTNNGSEPRYVWVNFETDMIFIEDEKVKRLAPHLAEIRRLKFTIRAEDELTYSYFFYHSDKFMGDFTALQELHMVLEDCILLWSTTFEHCFYGCPRENVRFLDPKLGLLLTGFQLEMVYIWGVEYGGRVYDVDDVDAEIEFIIEDRSDFMLDKFAEIE